MNRFLPLGTSGELVAAMVVLFAVVWWSCGREGGAASRFKRSRLKRGGYGVQAANNASFAARIYKYAIAGNRAYW